jgi:ATP-binding cassette subfamily B protein
MGYAFQASRQAVLRGAAIGVAWEVTVVLIPLFTQRAIDQGLVPGDWARLAFWLAILVVTGLATAYLSALRHRSATEAGARGTFRLRGRLVRHLLGLDAGFHDRVERGDVLTRTTTDVGIIGDLMDYLVTWVAHTAAIVLIIVLLLQMNVGLGVIGLAFIPVVFLLTGLAARSYGGRATALREATGRLTSVVHESIAGVRVVKGFGIEHHQRGRCERASRAIVDRALALARLDVAYLALGPALPALALVAGLWWGGQRAMTGELLVGELLAFGAWMVRLAGRTEGLLERLVWYLDACASARRVNALLDQRGAIEEPAHPVPLPAGGGELRFERVSVMAGERPLLEAVSFTVRPGETVALVGESGAGKSLLLSLVPRLYALRRGTIRLDGVAIERLSVADLRAAVCLASDDTMLFRDTVAANIALGRPDATPAEIEAAARQAQAHEFIADLPDGYGTVLGERGLTLSGGQRQRIALARALLTQPRLLLLDDVASSLDPATEATIRADLSSPNQRRTTLIATQRRSAAAGADRVVLLDRGRVVAEGSDADLWRQSPLYRRILGGGGAE